MRILHINTYNQFGGAEMIAHTLFKSNTENKLLVSEFKTLEHGVHKFETTFSDRFFAILTKLKWRFRPDSTFKEIFFLKDEFNHTYEKLKSLQIYKDADIVHLHNIHGGYFDLSALEHIGKEKKIVWTLHDMWCMTGGEAYTFDNENYKKGIGRTPFLHVPPLNNPIVDRRQKFIEQKKQIYERIKTNIVFVPVSNWLEKCFKGAYVFNEKLNVQTIHNGCDTHTFNINNRIISDTCRIIIFNSHSPFKGSEILKEVLESIETPFELITIGKKIVLQNTCMINQKEYDYVADRKMLASVYNSADVLIFPSKAEAFGLIPLESMACGVCVFASNVGGIPEIIEHGKTGFLFNSAADLIDLLKNTIHEKANISEIGQHAAKVVKEKFSLEEMVQKYDKLYAEMLQ